MIGLALRLILYHTDHCSACEHAFDLLSSMPELAGHALTTVDVATNDALIAKFGERIPVLAGEFGELNWPFDAQALRRVLAE